MVTATATVTDTAATASEAIRDEMAESRVKKSLLNAKVNLICYFASLIVAFFTRKIFLDYLGADFIGLTSTLWSVLGFLNIAELGLGTAIAYFLYKPLYDNNQEQIKELISLFGYMYRWIGIIILIGGVAVSVFLPIIYHGTGFSAGVIYVGFYSFLASSLLGYFVNYRTILLTADQKNYVITGYFQLITTSKVIIQMILAIVWTNFYVYFIVELIAALLISWMLNYKVDKTYPWMHVDMSDGKAILKRHPDIIKYIKQIFIHKIGTFVQFQLSPMLIYAFVSLPIVALYTNYTILTQRIQGAINNAVGGTGASVGNLIAEGNKTTIIKTYKQLLSLRLFTSSIVSLCTYYLANPFVTVWLGEQYMLGDKIVFLISFNLFLGLIRGTNDEFINGYGLFSDVWAPIAECVLSVGFAIILGKVYGLAGVLMGPIIATLAIINVWKPIFLFSKGFKANIMTYIITLAQNIIPIALSFALSLWIMRNTPLSAKISNGWGYWVVNSLYFSIVFGLISLAFTYPLSPGLRDFIARFVNKLRKR